MGPSFASEQKHAINHAHDPLHFAAKISMARRIDDINLRPFIKTDAFFEKIVIPRSRSSSFESMMSSVCAPLFR